VIFMEDFPRTFIGKVLRRELAKRYEQYNERMQGGALSKV
jgi:acyl-coenzyme A synthetase/AMP-(fatty) acid ligase